MAPHFLLSFLLLHVIYRGTWGATFTLVNRCEYKVWPGVLSNAGSPKLSTTGFELAKGSSRSPAGANRLSGRFWGRTGCEFDDSGKGTCRTGDCGSNQVECNGAGAAPPATLAEFTLGGAGGQDFYDVSLVDGYNLPMVVVASGGTGPCGATGCTVDLNLRCPAELRVGEAGGDGNGAACRSACEAFGKPEFCCSGAYANPNTCKPSSYASIFKSACPRAYSYAYDDATSTFTCANAGYTITFCPNFSSQKSSKDSPPKAPPPTGVLLSDEAWLASLATAAEDAASSCRAISWAGLVLMAASSIITMTVTVFL